MTVKFRDLSVIFAALILSGGGCANLSKKTDAVPTDCSIGSELQKLRAEELQTLVKDDQDIREAGGFKSKDLLKILNDDESRRKRVAEIFAEGCFATAKDYAAAALVFQHGTVPDHFFQAYLWSKKAMDLGDKSQKRLMAMAADRYLTKSGFKQLYGTQAVKTSENSCWCMEEVEAAFPDPQRRTVLGQGLDELLVWVKNLNQTEKKCKNVSYCKAKLRSPPKNILPGIW